MSETITPLMNLADALLQLKGVIGRTRLLQHLKETPEFHGQPTHRRISGKIFFRRGDIERVIESLECRSRSSNGKARMRSICAAPSEDKAYSKALELLTQNKQKLSAPKEKRNFGRHQSSESVPLSHSRRP